MKKYLTFFKIRLKEGLQYRAAAYAGMTTQFAWGFGLILLYRAFYRSPGDFPMEFSQLSTYIWMQQAFLALFAAWSFDNDILSSIETGGVATDLCRPADLYAAWATKSIASRIARATLRCLPILVVAAFLPSDISLHGPASPAALIMFIFAMVLGAAIMTAYSMLVYVSCFYTVSSAGSRMIMVAVVDLLSGHIVPIPFFPAGVRQVVELLPFSSMANTPLFIYSGYYSGQDALIRIGLQLFWAVALIALGKALMGQAIKKVVVQGG